MAGTTANTAKKKKLLYVITKSNWGGAQKYVYELATAMAGQTTHFHTSGKYDVTVALGSPSSGTSAKQDDESDLKKRLEEAGVRFISLPFLSRDINLFAEFSVFSQLLKLFREEQPDIVHLNSSKIGGLGSLAARFAKVPRIIFTVHGFAFREEWRGAIQRKIIKFLSWITMLLSHKVITVSDYDARQGREFPFVKEKISVIKNGILPSVFLSRQEARKILASDFSKILAGRKPLWAGTIGELHKNKGHVYAIQAVREIVGGKTDIIFIIIGEGEERENLEKLISEYELEEHVFLVGNRKDAVSLLPALDLFIFPSAKEGLPYAVLEAGFSTLPVIASSVGGVPEIITDMQSGILVRPKDAGEIVRAIDYLYGHPGAAEKFSGKLRQKVKKEFSQEKMLRETEQVYRQL